MASITKENQEILLPAEGKKNKSINWEKLKLSFFLSSYKYVRRFLVDEKYFTADEINSGNLSKNVAGWELEKKDWERQALEVTMHNLRDSKVVELKGFFEEEGKVVSQLLNMTKIAMNGLLVKAKVNGKDILELKNTKGFKQVTESTLMILKYSRERLGVAFNKEEEGINNAINFNFDLVNLDEFDPQRLISFFAKKSKEHGQDDRKPVEAVDNDGVLES